MEVTIHHRIHFQDDVVLKAILNLERSMSLDISALTAEVARVKTVDASIKLLLTSLADKITDAAGDQSKLDAIVADLKSSDDDIVASVTANTPAAPTPVDPAPVETPPAAPAPVDPDPTEPTPVDPTTPAPVDPTPTDTPEHTDTSTPVADTPAGIPPEVTATPTIPSVTPAPDEPLADPLAPANQPGS